MVISRKLLHSQTSYLVPRYNTIRDIKWHKPIWPWRKVKVTTEGQRLQTWRCLRSLNASCSIFDFSIFSIIFSFLSEICGKNITEPSGTLTSPYYPNDYPDNINCVWRIEVQDGLTGVVLTATHFSVEYQDICYWDWLTVRIRGNQANLAHPPKSAQYSKNCNNFWMCRVIGLNELISRFTISTERGSKE